MSKDKKSNRPVLAVNKRKVLGRKVKALRAEGILPANVYGKKVKSLSVQGSLVEIKKVFSQAGETGLVDLKVEGEKEVRPVLFSNPQVDPVSDQLLHLDFYQVDLTQKVNADIPIEISGEAPAVARSEGVLVQLLNEIEVEALPADLPEKLVVNVDSLDKVDEAISLKQALKASGWDLTKIETKVSLKQLLAKIEPPTKEEEKPVIVAEEEGEEGQEKGEEGKAEEKGKGEEEKTEEKGKGKEEKTEEKGKTEGKEKEKKKD